MNEWISEWVPQWNWIVFTFSESSHFFELNYKDREIEGTLRINIKTRMRKQSGRSIFDKEVLRQPSISATNFRKKDKNDILNSII